LVNNKPSLTIINHHEISSSSQFPEKTIVPRRPLSPLGSPWFLRLRGHVGRLGLGGRGGGGGCGCRSATAGGEAFGAADGAVGVTPGATGYWSL